MSTNKGNSDKIRSLDSSASIYRIEPGLFTNTNVFKKELSKIPVERPAPVIEHQEFYYGEQLHDAVSIVIRCKLSNTVGLTNLKKKHNDTHSLYFPTMALKFGLHANEIVDRYLRELTTMGKPGEDSHSLNRVGIKHQNKDSSAKPAKFEDRKTSLRKEVFSGLCKAKRPSSQTFPKLAQTSCFSEPNIVHLHSFQVPGRYEYITRTLCYVDVIGDISAPNLFANAPIVWYSLASNKESVKAAIPLWSNEVLLINRTNSPLWIETDIESLKISLQDGPENEFTQFVKQVFGETILSRLYSDFLQLIYPAQTMSFYTFKMLTTTLNLLGTDQDEVIRSFFFAYCSTKDQCLSLKDLVYGFAASDPKCPHNGICGQMRVEYIFRYYSNQKDTLSSENIRQIALDLMKSRGIDPINEEMTLKEIQTIYQAVNVVLGADVSKNAFSQAITNMTLRGTSSLFRLKNSAAFIIHSLQIFPDISLDGGGGSSVKEEPCFLCRAKKYVLSLHVVKTLSDGTIIEPQILQHKFYRKISKVLRKMSVMTFAMDNPLNNCIDRVRETFEVPFVHSFLKKHPQLNIQHIIEYICKSAEDMFKSENRILPVSSPCYVIGDLRGNLQTLLNLERCFWKMAPSSVGSSYIFLGNYIGEGEHSLEVLLYLLCMKFLAPNHFFLLRGRNEVRTKQSQFNFMGQIQLKLGSEIGQQVLELINSTFDSMPLGAVIDEQIFCSHSGIPQLSERLESIDFSVSNVLKTLEESPRAWEMINGRPSVTAEYEVDNKTASSPQNKTRNVGYTEEMLKNFLNLNRLVQVIRSGDVQSKGFSLQMDSQVLSIFSCANFARSHNEAAVVLAEDEKVRVIQIIPDDSIGKR